MPDTGAPTIDQIVAFLNTEAFEPAVAIFNRRAYAIDGRRLTFGLDDTRKNTSGEVAVEVNPDGTLRINQRNYPLVHINSTATGTVFNMWQRFRQDANDAAEQAVRNWLNPYSLTDVGLDHRRDLTHVHNDILTTAERRRYHGALMKLGHSVLNSALGGPAARPVTLLQNVLYEHIGRDTVQRALKYAGICANHHHFNAAVLYPQLLEEAHAINPNGLIIALLQHTDDADAALAQYRSPQDLLDAARGYFMSNHHARPHLFPWEILRKLPHRLLREAPHTAPGIAVQNLHDICETIARTGSNPPYTLLKAYMGHYRPWPHEPRAIQPVLQDLHFSASSLSRNRRGSTLRQFMQDVKHVNDMLECAERFSNSAYRAQEILDQAGINSTNVAHTWRVLATIGRRHASVLAENGRNEDHQAAFFYHLKLQDFRGYDIPHPVEAKPARRRTAGAPRKNHLIAALALPEVQQELAQSPRPYALDTVPGQSLKYSVAGETMLHVKRHQDGTITVSASPQYWTGQPLPNPQEPHEQTNAAWSSRSLPIAAISRRIAEILTEHWPNFTEEARKISPPTADAVYRHRDAIAHLLPQPAATVFHADHQLSRQIRRALAGLLDSDTYSIAAALAGGNPTIDQYNHAQANSRVLAETLRINPVAAIYHATHMADNSVPENAAGIITAASQHMNQRGWPQYLWPRAHRLPHNVIHHCLRPKPYDTYGIFRLIAAAEARVKSPAELTPLARVVKKFIEYSDFLTVPAARIAGIVAAHRQRNPRTSVPDTHIFTEYAIHLHNNRIPLPHRSYEAIRDAALHHHNRSNKQAA